MVKIKVLVVEDEVIIADNICNTLESFDYEVLEPAMSYEEAIERINFNQPDIAILDIQLAGKKNGIDLAQKINDEYDFPFIFLTSNSDRATFEEAKVAEPNAFLSKPFGKDELYAAIELGLFTYAKKHGAVDRETSVVKDALFIRQKAQFIRVNFEDIVYIQSDSVYLDIAGKAGKPITVRGSLNDYISKLNDNFLRCHRSYIINLDYLESINLQFAVVGGVEIPIGKKHRPHLLSRLNMG